MIVGHEIIKTAFFDTGRPAAERALHIQLLSESPGVTYAFDDAVIQSSDAYRALLLGRDPHDHASAIFERCQKVSAGILNSEYIGDLVKLLPREQIGKEAEIAIHNLAWWGIASGGVGRYVRMASKNEDRGGLVGHNRGYDIVLRTGSRRHKIQAKSNLKPYSANRYRSDIVVVSPQNLLLDPDATSEDLHESIRNGDVETLNMAWNSLLRELRTQKAPNGARQVI